MSSEQRNPSEAPDSGERAGWRTRGVISVALASFCSDSGHEMTTSVLPSFLTVTLRASAGALGLIEGFSDGLMGVAVLIAGPIANDERQRQRLASGGYLITAAATGAIGLAATVWQAGLLRAVSWTARGARSPVRDATLAALAPREAYGRAYGLERAGDNMGAVLGPLLAAGLVVWLGIRPTLYLAAIPGLFAALAITVAVSQARKRGEGGGRDQRRLRRLREADSRAGEHEREDQQRPPAGDQGEQRVRGDIDAGAGREHTLRSAPVDPVPATVCDERRDHGCCPTSCAAAASACSAASNRSAGCCPRRRSVCCGA
ncbi:MAG: MFS transporter [Solirubrobacteraceae bacterium]